MTRIPLLRAAPLALWLTVFGSYAEAQDAPGSKITDLAFVAAQAPSDANAVDGTANKYKFVRVIFRSGTDLEQLSKLHDRNLHVALSRCDDLTGEPNGTYEFGPAVYDAYGQITDNRAVAKTDALERFRGLYYFFLPTSTYVGNGTPNVFPPLYDLYVEIPEMCFEIPGNTGNFFSGKIAIPAAALHQVLDKRPR